MSAVQPFPSLETVRRCIAQQDRQALKREGYRHAAVLIPLLPQEGDWSLLLTRRTGDLPHHQGQIAFPGGSMDEGENCRMTALREAEEEVGLSSSRVEVLGCQDDILTPSGFVISPVLGLLSSADNLRPNPAEVSRIFQVPLSFFADEGNAVRQVFEFEGRSRDVYFYSYDGETIWGATALMIRNFLQALGMVEGD